MAAVVSLSVLAAVSACAVIDGSQKEASPPAPTAVTDTVRRIGDLADACLSKRGFFPALDAYGGPGPHPIAVFDENARGGVSPILNTPLQPPEWMNEFDPKRYQLIACLGRGHDNGEYVGDCAFAGGVEVPQYRGLYNAVVYEAKTGREVGRELIRGDHTSGCGILEVVDRENPKLYTGPTLIELQNVLGKYVS
ncbi:hypothetical protein [Nocardia sp. bgisy134]|uniref:hypothetical protein n=1 Tax=Nocardia sp. bgisy134 TaxID=3413789 RepID=UPI003D731E34